MTAGPITKEETMRTFTAKLGGNDVSVFAPAVGEMVSVETFRAYFPPGRLYGLDVESTSLGPQGVYAPDWRLRTVQVATERYAWVLNVEDPAQRAAAVDLLSDPKVEFTSHMVIDPAAVHQALGVDITSRFVDTYWLTVMCAPEDRDGGNELKPHVTKRIGPELAEADAELEAEFWRIHAEAHPYKLNPDGTPKLRKDGTPYKATKAKKTDVVAFGFTNVDVNSPTYLRYGGLDAIAVRALAPRLIKETRAPASLLSKERWLAQQAAKISIRGHRVDPVALDRLATETREKARSLEEAVAEATGGLTPRQNLALVKFFEAEGADFTNHPRTDNGKGAGPSLSKDHADLLLGYDLSERGRAAAEAFVAYAKILNRLTITESIAEKMVDGRIHPTLKTVGTVTGRMSSSGPNMQNFAKKDAAMRGLFIPEDGCVLMSCDFAQIELRVLAALAQEQAMIDVILADGDLHDLTAELLNITRGQAKTTNFQIVYGSGPKNLAEKLGGGMTIAEATRILDGYWSQYPAISRYKRQLERLTEVELISGRKVPAAINKKDGRPKTYANLNYMIQGSARELLVSAWHRFGVELGRAETVWMPIHDEIVLQVPEELAEEVGKEVQDCMTFPFMGVPIQADPDVLLDEHGDSRWMSGDHAREMVCFRSGAHQWNEKGTKCTYCGEKSLPAAA